MAKNDTKKMVTVKLIKSLIGRKPNHIASAHGLGLRRINSSVNIEDTPCNRGMINQIQYLLEIEEDVQHAS